MGGGWVGCATGRVGGNFSLRKYPLLLVLRVLRGVLRLRPPLLPPLSLPPLLPNYQTTHTIGVEETTRLHTTKGVNETTKLHTTIGF